jgi:N-glycosidase YbiA
MTPKEQRHDDTSRLERICNIVLRLSAETKEPHAAISAGTLNGLKRVVQAALDASRAERSSHEPSADFERWRDEKAAEAAHDIPTGQPPSAGPLKLDTDQQVFFYEQDHYYLSNFSAFRIRLLVDDGSGGEIHGSFDTSEAAYHWFKFPGQPELQARIRAAQSAHDAFKLAEHHRELRRLDWDVIKLDVMREILRAKAQQHEYVRRKLLETGDRELIENSWRDDYWGWGPNRDGQNMLGKLWMEIREELRAEAGPKATDFGGGKAE